MARWGLAGPGPLPGGSSPVTWGPGTSGKPQERACAVCRASAGLLPGPGPRLHPSWCLCVWWPGLCGRHVGRALSLCPRVPGSAQLCSGQDGGADQGPGGRRTDPSRLQLRPGLRTCGGAKDYETTRISIIEPLLKPQAFAVSLSPKAPTQAWQLCFGIYVPAHSLLETTI